MLPLLSILDNLMLRDFAALDILAQSVVLLALSMMAILKNSKPWLHKTLAVFMLLFLMGTIVVEWDRWLVGN